MATLEDGGKAPEKWGLWCVLLASLSSYIVLHPVVHSLSCVTNDENLTEKLKFSILSHLCTSGQSLRKVCMLFGLLVSESCKICLTQSEFQDQKGVSEWRFKRCSVILNALNLKHTVASRDPRFLLMAQVRS